MDRRDFLKTTGAAGAAAAFGSSPLIAGQGGKPNILMVMVDEMRRPMWFPDRARLPNYDALRSQGLEFKEHFVCTAPCSPSRATIWTGLYATQHNVKVNVGEAGQGSLIPRIPTIGQLLRQNGYRTIYSGKWHLTLPDEIGDKKLAPYGFNWIQPELPNKPHPWPGMANDPIYTDAACEWLTRKSKKRDQPWFLTLNLVNPHDICAFPRHVDWKMDLKVLPYTRDLPENWDDDLEDKPSCQRAQAKILNKRMGRMDPDDKHIWKRYLDYYYYFNRQMDEQLGRVIKALDDSGQREDTIVIFTSDHGDLAGSHKLRYKGANIYNENLNVPLVFSCPGRIPEGKRTDSISHSVDFFPTLAALAGIDAKAVLPQLPGRDLSPVLQDPDREVNSHALFSYAGKNPAPPKARPNDDVGEGDEDIEPTPAAKLKRNHIRSIRNHRWAYARYFNPAGDGEEFELNDLKHDPYQMENLASDPAAKDQRQKMAAKLQAALENEMGPIDPSRHRL